MNVNNPYSSISKVRLPNFYGIVNEFEKAALIKLHFWSRSGGPFSQIRSQMLHEGKAAVIQRGVEPPDAINMRSGTMEIAFDRKDIETFDENSANVALHKMADQHQQQLNETFYDTMDKATAKTGNKVGAQGKPLTNEMLLEVLEKMEHDFPAGPGSSNVMAVVSPAVENRLKVLKEEFENSPELQAKHKLLMTKKYEKFRDREMDRDLAG